jgi:hypothetical protein
MQDWGAMQLSVLRRAGEKVCIWQTHQLRPSTNFREADLRRWSIPCRLLPEQAMVRRIIKLNVAFARIRDEHANTFLMPYYIMANVGKQESASWPMMASATPLLSILQIIIGRCRVNNVLCPRVFSLK